MAFEITSSNILSPEELTKHIKVNAGPGAGKTHFLVQNIKNIVTTNSLITEGKVRKVLCITYTNSAVNELKTRLEKFIDYVDVYTIHSFIIEHIIMPFQQDLIDIMKSDFDISVNPNGKISSQIEGLSILHGVNKEEIFQFIKNKNIDKFEDDQFGYSKKIMGEVEVDNKPFVDSIISKTNPIYTIKGSNKIKDDHLYPLKEYIWSIVRKLTHNEVLFFGYRIIEKNPTALYSLRVKFPFIFVDEFQDTNPLQTLLIKKIGETSTIVGVVGDIAQSIYSFQGATPSYFENFEISGKEIAEYTISDNRRSTQNIIHLCNFFRQKDISVIQQSARAYQNKKESEEIEATPIHFLIGDSSQIQEIIHKVISDNGVVLTRAWAAAFDYIQGINAEQINLLKKIYNSYYNSPIQLRDEIVEHNNVTWVRAFRFIFSLWESYKSGSFIDIVFSLKLISDISLKIISPRIIFLIDDLAKNIFNKVESNYYTYDIIKKYNELILEETYSDLAKYIGESNSTIKIFDEQDSDSLVESVKKLQWDTSYKLFTEVFSENSKYMTVHQAKGLEWDKVIVSAKPNKFDGITLEELYSNPSISNESSSDEFTRLYYVACSRAKNELYIHLPSTCTKELIEHSLSTFINKSKNNIAFDFIE